MPRKISNLVLFLKNFFLSLIESSKEKKLRIETEKVFKRYEMWKKKNPNDKDVYPFEGGCSSCSG